MDNIFSILYLQVITLVFEAFDKSQKSCCGAITCDGQSSCITNKANLILHAKSILGFTKSCQPFGGVVGSIETGIVGIELVEGVIGVSDRFFLCCKGNVLGFC